MDNKSAGCRGTEKCRQTVRGPNLVKLNHTIVNEALQHFLDALLDDALQFRCAFLEFFQLGEENERMAQHEEKEDLKDVFL